MGIVGMLVFIPLLSVVYTIFRKVVYLRLKKRHIKQVTATDIEEYIRKRNCQYRENIKKLNFGLFQRENEKQREIITVFGYDYLPLLYLWSHCEGTEQLTKNFK